MNRIRQAAPACILFAATARNPVTVTVSQKDKRMRTEVAAGMQNCSVL